MPTPHPALCHGDQQPHVLLYHVYYLIGTFKVQKTDIRLCPIGGVILGSSSFRKTQSPAPAVLLVDVDIYVTMSASLVSHPARDVGGRRILQQRLLGCCSYSTVVT